MSLADAPAVANLVGGPLCGLPIPVHPWNPPAKLVLDIREAEVPESVEELEKILSASDEPSNKCTYVLESRASLTYVICKN
jgi:hypothetical protein